MREAPCRPHHIFIRSLSTGDELVLQIRCLTVELPHKAEAPLQLSWEVRHALHKASQVCCHAVSRTEPARLWFYH